MLSSSICNNNKISNLLIWIGLKKLYKKMKRKTPFKMKKKKTVGEGVWNLEFLSLKFFYVWFPDRNMVATLVRRINWLPVTLLRPSPWFLYGTSKFSCMRGGGIFERCHKATALKPL